MRSPASTWLIPPLALLLAAPAWAEQVERTQRSFGARVAWWFGAFMVVLLVGRFVFREQLNERRTIKKLIHQIGPYFSEFDTDLIRKWVERTAPHVFAGWRRGDFDSLGDFATPEFRAQAEQRFAEAKAKGWERLTKLQRVLKVHPLGVYLAGEGPAPKDVELVLRIEAKALDLTRDAEGKRVRGQAAVAQVQHLWILRHDGLRWRLHGVESGEREVTDLAKRPPLPPLMEWKRPGDPDEETNEPVGD